MNPFIHRATGAPWVLPVSMLSLVLGFMMILAWIPVSRESGRGGGPDIDLDQRLNAAQIEQSLRDEYQRMTVEVKKLREEKTQLENAMGDQTRQSKVLNDTLQDTKLFTGLTEVEGPGVTITLKDSERADSGSIPNNDLIVHDVDVLRVVNELRASGAEAIAINNQRVIGRTSIRCVGPTIQVDGVPVASPVRIRAVGDPEAMIGGLNLRNGVLDEIRQADPAMVTLEKVERHHLPAYAGATATKFLQVAGASK
ncbi:MAG: DUF881 domain-containing protein [Armatimonadetes bacterium]|nr:DUF881 domain-containing protein [Armatimonadota bacterium]